MFGIGWEEPAAAGFLDQMLIVFGRFKTKQRQAESVLAARLAMATTRVAPELCENRDDLVGEVNGDLLVELLHRHRERPQDDRLCHRLANPEDHRRSSDGEESRRRLGIGTIRAGNPVRHLIRQGVSPGGSFHFTCDLKAVFPPGKPR